MMMLSVRTTRSIWSDNYATHKKVFKTKVTAEGFISNLDDDYHLDLDFDTLEFTVTYYKTIAT